MGVNSLAEKNNPLSVCTQGACLENTLPVSQVVALLYDLLFYCHAVFDYGHRVCEVYHCLSVVEGDDGIGIQAAYLYHALQVGVGVVFFGRGPSVDDKADRPAMMLFNGE